MAQDFLTLHELSRLSGFSLATLRRLIAKGDLACIRTQVGPSAKHRTHGSIRILRADWDDWLRRHRSPVKAEVAPPVKKRPVSVLDLPGATHFLS